MDHAFVINLKEKKDRWSRIKKELEGTQLKLHRIEAIKKNPGSYGLLLTFIKILKLAIQNEYSNILILEDDCKVIPGWEERWTIIKEWLAKHPDKWDVYSGGSMKNRNPNYIGSLNSLSFFIPYTSRSTHWIYIPKRFYKTLLQLYESHMVVTQFNPTVGVDVLHNMIKRVISYPYLAYQHDGHSSLTKKVRKLQPIFKRAELQLSRTRKRHS